MDGSIPVLKGVAKKELFKVKISQVLAVLKPWINSRQRVVSSDVVYSLISLHRVVP